MEPQEFEQERAVVPVRVEADETPSIAALAAALAKAQGAMKGASKDAENPHFRSKYADLASIWTACRGPLSANGLAVLQRVSTVPEGVLLTTMLVHSSGEWVRDRATFPVAQRTPQALGSAITYARRYALAALVGVAAEDDDGNEASQAPYPRPASPEPPPQRSAKPASKKEAAPEPSALSVRVRRAWETAQAQGMTTDGFRSWAKELLGVERPSKEWTAEQVERLETALHQMVSEAEKDAPH